MTSSGTLFFSTTNIHQYNTPVWKYQSPLFSWGFMGSLLSTETKSYCLRLVWEMMPVVFIFYINIHTCIYTTYNKLLRKFGQWKWESIMRQLSWEYKGLDLFCDVHYWNNRTITVLLPFMKSISASFVYTTISVSPAAKRENFCWLTKETDVTFHMSI